MTEKELEFTIRILKDIIENNGGTYLVNRYRELQQLKDLKDKNKETLEEAAGKATSYYTIPEIKKHHVESFVKGAKWQQERMYSEKEVENIISNLVRDCYYMQEPNQDVANWFEQFKKK